MDAAAVQVGRPDRKECLVWHGGSDIPGENVDDVKQGRGLRRIVREDWGHWFLSIQEFRNLEAVDWGRFNSLATSAYVAVLPCSESTLSM